MFDDNEKRLIAENWNSFVSNEELIPKIQAVIDAFLRSLGDMSLDEKKRALIGLINRAELQLMRLGETH